MALLQSLQELNEAGILIFKTKHTLIIITRTQTTYVIGNKLYIIMWIQFN